MANNLNKVKLLVSFQNEDIAYKVKIQPDICSLRELKDKVRRKCDGRIQDQDEFKLYTRDGPQAKQYYIDESDVEDLDNGNEIFIQLNSQKSFQSQSSASHQYDSPSPSPSIPQNQPLLSYPTTFAANTSSISIRTQSFVSTTKQYNPLVLKRNESIKRSLVLTISHFNG